MAKEIERRFLVVNDEYRRLGSPVLCRQGYLSTARQRTVRVRILGQKGYLAVKGNDGGLARTEFEYEIPTAEAEEMLGRFCEYPVIEKKRYEVSVGSRQWQVDEFSGENEGLVIAEVHIDDENDRIEIPEWAGKEISRDPKYINANLVKRPYTTW